MSGSVLFDLDGTLTDPFLGITSSIQHALRQMGQEPPLPEDLRRYIGPPLQQNFMEMLGDEVLAAQAVGFYRARYGETGKFENELIPGMTEVLQTMADAEIHAVCRDIEAGILLDRYCRPFRPDPVLPSRAWLRFGWFKGRQGRPDPPYPGQRGA